MTINTTIEIEAWTSEIIERQRREWTGRDQPLSVAAMKALMAYLDLDDDDRKAVTKSFGAFVCLECGQASCLHGYSDD